MKATRNRVLVLGLGNPLAGDDGFGPRVIERLQGAPPADAHLVDAHTDLLSWIEEFAGYQLVVLIDAFLAPATPAGEVVVLTEEQLAGFPDASPSIHQLSPLMALRLFRQLYPDARTRIVLVALQTHSIVLGSDVDERAVQEGVRQVLSLLENSGQSPLS